MAQLGYTFNSADAPESDFEPLPAGDYSLMITESEMKPNSNKNGHFLELKMEVQDGNYQGKSFYERLNLDNPSEKAVTISVQTLAKICDAIGKPTITDSEELHGIRFTGSIEVEAGKPYKDKITGKEKMGNPQNKIESYSAHGARAATASEKPAAIDSKDPPWKKK